jgi:hypothetical protein
LKRKERKREKKWERWWVIKCSNSKPGSKSLKDGEKEKKKKITSRIAVLVVLMLFL